MEHIAALLLIIGCSADLGECRELPAPAPLFETVEECDEALPAGLGSASGGYPRLFAQCVFVDPALEEEDAELVWDVRPNGTLEASINFPDADSASGGAHTQNVRAVQE